MKLIKEIQTIFKNGITVKLKIKKNKMRKSMKQDDREEKKAYYIKIINGTRQDENKYRFVKLPDNFLRGEKGQNYKV